MALDIREATLADAASIGPLVLELGYDGNDKLVRRRLDRVLRLTDNTVFVAVERPHGVVGFIHAGTRCSLLGPTCIEIGALLVGTDYRGSGVGRGLVERVHTWAIKRGIDDVVVRAAVHRDHAAAFYQRLGYTEVKQQNVFTRDLALPGGRPTGEHTVMD